MAQRLKQLRQKLSTARGKYVTELKRQLVHALGILTVIPLIIFPEKTAVRIFIILILLTLFGNWYMTKRRLREKHFHHFVRQLDLPQHEELAWKNSTSNVKKFEEKVLLKLLKNFKRRQERQPLMATFWFLFSSTLALLLFGTPFAAIGLIVLGIGDAFSTIIGKRWGKTKLLYNKDKSLEGSIAFFFTAFFAVWLFLKIFPQFALLNPLALAAIAALTGAAIETIPTINDNATIPLGVAFVIQALFIFVF